jgi:hypothetical protein
MPPQGKVNSHPQAMTNPIARRPGLVKCDQIYIRASTFSDKNTIHVCIIKGLVTFWIPNFGLVQNYLSSPAPGQRHTTIRPVFDGRINSGLVKDYNYLAPDWSTYQALESLGDRGGKALLPSQLRDHEHVLRGVHLVRTVGTTCQHK